MDFEYVETDGLNNQLVAFNHACFLSLHTGRTLLMQRWLRPHLNSPSPTLRWCDILDCRRLPCRVVFGRESNHTPRECGSVDCLLRSDSPFVRLPDKVVFRTFFDPRWKSIAKEYLFSTSLPIHPRILSSASRLISPPYDVAHIRQVEHPDYRLSGSSRLVRVNQTDERVCKLDRRTSNPLYLMTITCSFLTPSLRRSYSARSIFCMQDLFPSSHIDEACLISQMAAVFASNFYPDDIHSTVSQFVMRRRWPSDRSFLCDQVSCWKRRAYRYRQRRIEETRDCKSG